MRRRRDAAAARAFSTAKVARTQSSVPPPPPSPVRSARRPRAAEIVEVCAVRVYLSASPPVVGLALPQSITSPYMDRPLPLRTVFYPIVIMNSIARLRCSDEQRAQLQLSRCPHRVGTVQRERPSHDAFGPRQIVTAAVAQLYRFKLLCGGCSGCDGGGSVCFGRLTRAVCQWSANTSICISQHNKTLKSNDDDVDVRNRDASTPRHRHDHGEQTARHRRGRNATGPCVCVCK